MLQNAPLVQKVLNQTQHELHVRYVEQEHTHRMVLNVNLVMKVQFQQQEQVIVQNVNVVFKRIQHKLHVYYAVLVLILTQMVIVDYVQLALFHYLLVLVLVSNVQLAMNHRVIENNVRHVKLVNIQMKVSLVKAVKLAM